MTDINKIEKQIQELIDSGKIESKEEIKDIPIDQISDKLNICIKDLMCYYCSKEYNTKCSQPDCNKG